MSTALKESMVQYPSEDITVHAYLVVPEGTTPSAAIIVVQEWWGLNEHTKDVARRYAREDYIAIAPDMYSRLGHKITTDADEAGTFMGMLAMEDGLKDLNATMSYLKTLPRVDANRIGVTGFCMGGSYALMLPCVSREIKAAVPFYGQVPNPDTPLQNLACPVLYLYGEDDGWITRADVQRLAEGLKKYNKPGEIKTYPDCPHAFCNDTRKEVYKEAEAQDAWNRALAHFRTHLKG